MLTAGKHYAAIPLWELLMHHKGTNVVCWPDSDTLRRELPKRNTDGTLKRDANGMPILPSDRTLIRWRGYIQDAGLIQYKINARLGDLQPNVSPDTRVCVYYFDTAYSMMSKENQPNPANRWRGSRTDAGQPRQPLANEPRQPLANRSLTPKRDNEEHTPEALTHLNSRGVVACVSDGVLDEVAATLNAASQRIPEARSDWSATRLRKPVEHWMAKGYVLDDFKRVIRAKAREWGKWIEDGVHKGAKRLVPDTLFGSKFAEYVGPKRWTVAQAEQLAATYGDERADQRLSIDGQNLADLRREAAEAAAADAERQKRERAEDAERQRKAIQRWIDEAEAGSESALWELRHYRRQYPAAEAYLQKIGDAGEQPDEQRRSPGDEFMAHLEAWRSGRDRGPAEPASQRDEDRPMSGPAREQMIARQREQLERMAAEDMDRHDDASAAAVNGPAVEPEPVSDADREKVAVWLASDDRTAECTEVCAELADHPPDFLPVDRPWTWTISAVPTTNDDGTPGRLTVQFNGSAPFPATPEEAERLRQLDAERPELPRRPGITVTLADPENAPAAWQRLLRAYRESENTP